MKLAVDRVVKGWRSTGEFSPVGFAFVQNKVGFGRRYASHIQAPLAEKAFSAFGLRIDAPEPMYGHMIGNNYADGAFVHEHTDPAPAGYAHVRCNWMVKKPPVGGDPILDGELVSVDEGDLWLCIASLERHSTTPISGGERIIYSFGGLVALNRLRDLLADQYPLDVIQTPEQIKAALGCN